jgi:peptidoglycan hydrolase-like protein with peptidoglycan-binding domain
MFHRGVFLALASITTLGMAPIAWGQDGDYLDTPHQLAQQVEDFTIPTETPEAPAPSEDVGALQQRLLELGYYTGEIDGIFNPETREALSDFQQQVGLARTGILDPLTRQQLGLAPAGETLDIPDLDPSATPEENANPLTDGLETDPDGLTEEETTGDNAAASAPGEATAASAAGESAEAEQEPAANESASDQESGGGGSRRWLMGVALVGLAIALLGSIGGAVLLILSRRSPSGDSLAATEAEQPLTPDLMDPEVPVTPVVAQAVPPSPPPTAPARSVPEPQNGHHSAPPPSPQPPPAAVPPAAAIPGPDASALAATPPSRLSKVNIVDELIQDLSSPDPGIRRKAIWELGQRGNSVASQPLVSLMMDADSKERSLILAALAEISTRTLKPMNRALQLSLQDENPEVRKNAIRDMTRIYDLMGQAGKLLGHAASDDDAEVRQTAAWAMDQFNRLRLKATGGESPSLPGRSQTLDSLPQDTERNSAP